MKWIAAFLVLAVRLYADGFSYIDGEATDLGNFYPFQVNDLDQILGDLLGPGGTGPGALNLMQGGSLTQIGLPGGITTGGLLNNLGEVLGTTTINNIDHLFFYSGDSYTDLTGFIPSGQKVIGEALNNLGQIMIETYNPLSPTSGSAYIISSGVSRFAGTATANGAVVNLYSFNNSGQSLGTGSFNGSPNYIYQNGVLTALPSINNFPNAHAVQINDAGEIIGVTNGGGGLNPGGFIYSNGAFTLVTFPPSAISSTGNYLLTAFTTGFAVNSSFIDLRQALFGNYGLYHQIIEGARAVNDSGDVVGNFSDYVVPEPNSAALSLIGLGSLGVAAWRKRVAGRSST